uniref:Uncharacterized protein n=1 Tax=Cyanothece sp. (strain PCC 7425 / ATCC 29141) TaxID=395961 RepID=B8HYD3_CYAP4
MKGLSLSGLMVLGLSLALPLSIQAAEVALKPVYSSKPMSGWTCYRPDGAKLYRCYSRDSLRKDGVSISVPQIGRISW